MSSPPSAKKMKLTPQELHDRTKTPYFKPRDDFDEPVQQAPAEPAAYSPTSPAYSPTSPAYSPMSPPFSSSSASPLPQGEPYDPLASPRSPPYSPVPELVLEPVATEASK